MVPIATGPIHSLSGLFIESFSSPLECKLYIIYYWVGQKVHLACPHEAERNFLANPIHPQCQVLEKVLAESIN